MEVIRKDYVINFQEPQNYVGDCISANNYINKYLVNNLSSPQSSCSSPNFVANFYGYLKKCMTTTSFENIEMLM